jgi:hypothetical protein
MAVIYLWPRQVKGSKNNPGKSDRFDVTQSIKLIDSRTTEGFPIHQPFYVFSHAKRMYLHEGHSSLFKDTAGKKDSLANAVITGDCINYLQQLFIRLR